MERAPRLDPEGGPQRLLIGRYVLFGEIASGGMASVHYARLNGPAGFARTVAIKRMHAHFAKDPEFVAMFLDEARLAARIRHPNVVPTLDVVTTEGEIFLVMEYVQGESLGRLLRGLRGSPRPQDMRVMATIMSNVLLGLHAAHEAKNEQGEALGIVHRDVSPQNVLVGVDGVARVLDFGVAKAVGRLQTTREGQVKGKLSYMAPEQLHGAPVTRRSDIYAASVVTWEALTGQRLFKAESEAAMVTAVLQSPIPMPSSIVSHVPPSVDGVVMRGLSRNPERRYATAKEMALELEKAAGVASPSEIGDWVESLAHEELNKRANHVAQIESVTSSDPSRISLLTASDMPTMLIEPSEEAVRGEGSGVSSIAVQNPPLPSSPPHRQTKRTILLAVGALAMLLLTLWIGVMMGSRRSVARDDLVPSAAPPSSEPVAVPSVALAVAVVPPAGVSADTPAPPSAEPQTAAGPSSTPAAPTATHRSITGHGPARTSTPTAPGAGDCFSPYWYDAQGHKRWKEACLK